MLKKIAAVILLIAGGILFLMLGLSGLKEIRTFPQTEATVVAVEREWVPNGDGSDTEQLTFHVSYTVDGKQYEEVLQNAKGSLEKGDRIQVYYNPQKPEYVSGATKSKSMLEIGFGALCLLGAVILGIRILRRR